MRMTAQGGTQVLFDRCEIGVAIDEQGGQRTVLGGGTDAPGSERSQLRSVRMNYFKLVAAWRVLTLGVGVGRSGGRTSGCDGNGDRLGGLASQPSLTAVAGQEASPLLARNPCRRPRVYRQADQAGTPQPPSIAGLPSRDSAGSPCLTGGLDCLGNPSSWFESHLPFVIGDFP